MRNNNLKLIYTAVFAIIIFLGTTFLKIQIAPKMMVHMGNALVVIAFFALKWKHAMLAASIGFGIFDVMNGYTYTVHNTIIESVIVVLVLHYVFKLLKEKLTITNYILISAVAGIVKIIVIFVRRLIENSILLPSHLVLPTTLSRMPNTLVTALITAIVAPLILSQITKYIVNIRENF